MADQLSLYNGALLLAGERFLASLSEEREPRRLLDRVWSSNVIRTCLEEGQWNFAMRTQQLDYDPSITPTFGYARAFAKPDDWVLTSAMSADEWFRVPLTRCVDEANYWYSDVDTIYVRFVSDDAQYGGAIADWPESFREFVEAHMASKIIGKLANDGDEVKRILKLRNDLLEKAKSKSAMASPTSFPAQGSWSRSRNRFPNRRDGGGTTGNLIG